MKIILNLNQECKNLLPKVDEVFLFDDCAVRLLLSDLLVKTPDRAIGLKTVSKEMTAQISFYSMPNGKVCAVAYPTSVKVDYDKFNKKIRKVFSHVEKPRYSSEPYGFLLYCKDNGYELKHSKHV